MQLKNPFPQEIRNYFIDCWKCSWCGRNGQGRGGLELHHIKGRESDSILNASVVCGECHSHMKHTDDEEAELLIKTIRFILKYFPLYQFTEKDIEFYAKNKKLYDKTIGV